MLLPGSQIRRLREEAPSNFATLLYKVVNNHYDIVEIDVKCRAFLCLRDYLRRYSTRVNEDGDGEHIQL